MSVFACECMCMQLCLYNNTRRFAYLGMHLWSHTSWGKFIANKLLTKRNVTIASHSEYENSNQFILLFTKCIIELTNCLIPLGCVHVRVCVCACVCTCVWNAMCHCCINYHIFFTEPLVNGRILRTNLQCITTYNMVTTKADFYYQHL